MSSSIKKNFMYNVVYQILLIILPLITTPYISRILGSEGLGTYTYTYTIANYFMLAAMLGVKNYGNRSVAAVRKTGRCSAACSGRFTDFSFFARPWRCLCISAMHGRKSRYTAWLR